MLQVTVENYAFQRKNRQKPCSNVVSGKTMGYHRIEFYVIRYRIASVTTVEMNQKPSDTVVSFSLYMRLSWEK